MVEVGMIFDHLVLSDVNLTENDIGHGAFGRVFEVNYHGTQCAAKEIHALLLQYAQGEELRKITNDFLNECQIWSTIRHPYVVQFLGVYYKDQNRATLPIMVMEKMQCSLRSLVEEHVNIPLNVKLSILDDVCLGIRYLHSRDPPIVHRDLTPNNILLGSHLEAKITDLGVAKVVPAGNTKTMTNVPGTPDFMPPEALTRKPSYGPPLDIFSYGGVVLYVISQQWPEPTDKLQSNNGEYEVLTEVKRRQHHLDALIRDAVDLRPLVTTCLDDDPQNRPLVANVSEEIKRVKDHTDGRHVMSPIAWWAMISGHLTSQQMVSSAAKPVEMAAGNEGLKKEITDLKNDNDGLRKKNDYLNTQMDNLKKQIDDLKVKNDDLSKTIAQLKEDNKSLKAEKNNIQHYRHDDYVDDDYAGNTFGDLLYHDGGDVDVDLDDFSHHYDVDDYGNEDRFF